MRRKTGFTLIELLIVVAIIAILAAIAVPNFLEAQVRSKVSRVAADMRSMTTALASYYVDNNSYPLSVVLLTSMTQVRNSLITPTVATTAANVDIPGPKPLSLTNCQRPTFAIAGLVGGGNEFFTLTTPISYITSYFVDPFSNGGRESFTYLPDGPGFILASYGPDADEGTNFTAGGGSLGSLVRTLRVQFLTPATTPFNGRAVATSRGVIRTGQDSTGSNEAYTYDPTNGTTSVGDIYRLSD
jgi:prepilin-type N-terminal cleavage/methylation domain-containing protein